MTNISYEIRRDKPGRVKAIIETPHLPFEEVVDAVRSRCNRFALDLIEARERADSKTARSMLDHISGLCLSLTMLAQDRKEDWRASAYATRSCAVDWRDLFDRDIAAKHGAIPRLGQVGTFYVNVGGFGPVALTFRPRASFKLPFFRMPRGFSIRGLNAAALDYRSR